MTLRAFPNRRLFAAIVFLGGVVILGFAAGALRAGKTEPPWPDRFLIGRRTYFDFGPPFEFYEIFSVRTSGDGELAIERIQLTPPGDVCMQSASVKVEMGSIRESVSDLLGTKNPCAIPAKEVDRELKLCKLPSLNRLPRKLDPPSY